jgi:hypothetical protein
MSANAPLAIPTWPCAVALALISSVAASLVLTSQASLTSRARLVELGGMGDVHLHAVLSPERGVGTNPARTCSA